MFGKAIVRGLLAAALVGLLTLGTKADTITHGSTTINMDFVNVGNAGNTADDTTYGAVGYDYRIGTYEVTADQWAAVIAADPNVGNTGDWSGSQPTGGTSFHEAAKFCNWLTTGNANSGYYAIDVNGHATPSALSHVDYAALYGMTYFIPTEDEWYKAAYYDSSLGIYYNYPTGSDTKPISPSPQTPAFEAVYAASAYQDYPNAVTNAGVASPYGTIGQGGNVSERNETAIGPSATHGLRGGAWYNTSLALSAYYRPNTSDTNEYHAIGFRVASVPEPSSLALLAGVALTALLCWWRKRA